MLWIKCFSNFASHINFTVWPNFVKLCHLQKSPYAGPEQCNVDGCKRIPVCICNSSEMHMVFFLAIRPNSPNSCRWNYSFNYFPEHQTGNCYIECFYVGLWEAFGWEVFRHSYFNTSKASHLETSHSNNHDVNDMLVEMFFSHCHWNIDDKVLGKYFTWSYGICIIVSFM